MARIHDHLLQSDWLNKVAQDCVIPAGDCMFDTVSAAVLWSLISGQFQTPGQRSAGQFRFEDGSLEMVHIKGDTLRQTHFRCNQSMGYKTCSSLSHKEIQQLYPPQFQALSEPAVTQRHVPATLGFVTPSVFKVEGEVE